MAATRSARRGHATAGSQASGPPSDVHPVLRKATAPPAALDLLAQAHAGLAEAAAAPTLPTSATPPPTWPPCAPRRRCSPCGAAPRRRPRRRRRIRSAWEVLPEVAPELAEWSALFASGAPRRARAEAGIPGRGRRPGRRRPHPRHRDVPAAGRADALAPADPSPAGGRAGKAGRLTGVAGRKAYGGSRRAGTASQAERPAMPRRGAPRRVRPVAPPSVPAYRRGLGGAQ